jgi:hypothetical protein
VSNTSFSLSSGQDEWIYARHEEPKRVSAGTGDLLIDRKPFENGTTIVTSVPVTITGPGKVTVTDADPSEAPQPERAHPTKKPKSKSKKKGKK